jgi:ABC-type transporter Mla maintaining outer membrane lipid asymmetry ATPase subunit MlaF
VEKEDIWLEIVINATTVNHKTINITKIIDSTKIIKDKGVIIKALIEETIAREEDTISTNI